MNYLIIGASSGLGRDLAYKFSQNSHNIILVSRDERDLKALQSDIESKFNSKVSIHNVDCSSHEEVNAFINTNLDVFKNSELVSAKIFKENFEYNNKSSKFELGKYEKNIQKNLSQKLSEYIIRHLYSIK